MSDNFDKDITYLSVINITENEGNSSGTVLGEIKSAGDIANFNKLTKEDKPIKIIEFKDAITKISANPTGTPGEPATTTIIIEGLISGNQYEFAKINDNLDNFNTYSLADKKTMVQDLINSVLLSDSTSSEGKGEGEKKCMIPSDVKPLVNTAVHKTVECIINALTEQDMESLKNKLQELYANSDLTLETVSSESQTIINGNTVMSRKFETILNKCTEKEIPNEGSGSATFTSSDGEKSLVVDLKNPDVEAIKSWTTTIHDVAFTGLKICTGPAMLAAIGEVAEVVPNIGPTLNYVLQLMATFILVNNVRQHTAEADAANVEEIDGGRPKKKTRKRKSRKSRKTKRKSRKSRKGKGRSRKIKRKHR